MMGLELPDRIVNAPELDEAFEFYVDAFWELSTERQFGMGIGPIPITAMQAYARHYEMDDEEEFDFVYFIKAMDATYIKEQTEKKP